jgi:hypothetical protein
MTNTFLHYVHQHIFDVEFSISFCVETLYISLAEDNAVFYFGCFGHLGYLFILIIILFN